MDTMTVELLADIPNGVIVRTPGRQYPGIVVQGDRLHYLHMLARMLCDSAAKGLSETLQEDACELSELLSGMVTHYEATLDQHGLELPY